MRIDYKTKVIQPQMGSPIFRRTMHVGLGFTAFVCLALSVTLGKNVPSKNEMALSVEMPMPVSSEKVQPEKPKFVEKTRSLLKVQPKVSSEDKSALAPVAEKNFLDTSILKTSPIEFSHKSSREPELLDDEDTTDNLLSIKIKDGDTLSKILTRHGISTKVAHEIINTNVKSRQLASLKNGQTLKLRVNAEKQLTALSFDISPGNALHVSRTDDGFHVEQKLTPLEKQLAFGKGKIQNSLFSAAKRAGLDHNIISQFVEIFGWNIDFSLDLQPNDTFRVLFEEKCLEGERIQTGNILAAEIRSNGKTHQAVRYTDKAGRTGYFTPEGYGMHQAFLRAPVNFTRVSSTFGLRNHPIMHRIRQHKGVDYAAPRGTPVQATGDGKVIYVGKRGGYGNVVELQHGARYTTLYGHLSRFPNGLRSGAEVKQGQVIGFVGRTGYATGDHLHYEFRIDGIHHNPLTVSLPKRTPIPETNKRHFIAHAKELLRLLDIHEHKINMARGDDYPVHE